ncbi:MAG: serine hydrolase [Planctomycetota bacterium]|jgi:hypothetical protein
MTSPTRHPGRRASVRVLIATGAIGLSASACLADLTEDLSTLMNDNVQGGEWGFLLKQVDGPVRASVNPDYLFYPASSIKVVQHVHAMKMIETANNGVDLTTMLNVYVTQNDACDDDHTGQDFDEQTMEDTLRQMMEQSHNQDTNAIQEFFGRDAINATVHGVGGMSDATQLNHKFGGDCGGPQPGQNQMPLSDSVVLYERIAKGQVFDADETRDTFYDLMLNNGHFSDIIDEEAPEHLSQDALDEFKSGVRGCRKPGSWGEGIKSLSGWIYLPPPPCNDGTPREFTYGVFYDFADSVAEDFGPLAVVNEMLRNEIREILEEWQECLACDEADGACDEEHASPGCTSGECCAAVCAVEPFCCTVAWDALCVATAIELCGLGQPNDDCADAEPFTGNTELARFRNASSDGSSHPGCGWDAEFIKDVWFTYTAQCDGQLEIEALAGFESWVAVYDLAPCPVTGDDLIDCHQFGPDAVDEIFPVCAEAGRTYLIRVGAANTEDADLLLRVNCSTELYGNGSMQENPSGVGLANTIVADDFIMGCDHGGFGWLNLQVVDLDGGGPPSTVQWHLFESNAVGTPGPEIASGIGADAQFTPIEGGATGAELFDLVFAMELSPTVMLAADTTYWLGFSAPGLLPLSTDDQSGMPAQSQFLGGWQPAAGDFAFTLDRLPPQPCPADTDGDGTVGVDDLVNVILDWGSAAAPNNGDVDGNGFVDVDDLLLVIVSWGACP